MLCIKFKFKTDKMIYHVEDLSEEGNGYGDILNPKHIFLSMTSPNKYLKTTVTPEWFEKHKITLGYI